MFEPWPDEPDESEVEQRWGNPERELPRIPQVSTSETDVDPEVAQTFWVSVIFANAAVFGVSLGAMLWYFRGQALLGGVLLGAGLLAGLRTYTSYRSFKRGDSVDEGEENTPDDATDGADGETEPDPTDATDDSDEDGPDVERTVAATSSADSETDTDTGSDTDTDADIDIDTDTSTADTTADSAERNG